MWKRQHAVQRVIKQEERKSCTFSDDKTQTQTESCTSPGHTLLTWTRLKHENTRLWLQTPCCSGEVSNTRRLHRGHIYFSCTGAHEGSIVTNLTVWMQLDLALQPDRHVGTTGKDKAYTDCQFYHTEKPTDKNLERSHTAKCDGWKGHCQLQPLAEQVNSTKALSQKQTAAIWKRCLTRKNMRRSGSCTTCWDISATKIKRQKSNFPPESSSDLFKVSPRQGGGGGGWGDEGCEGDADFTKRWEIPDLLPSSIQRDCRRRDKAW